MEAMLRASNTDFNMTATIFCRFIIYTTSVQK